MRITAALTLLLSLLLVSQYSLANDKSCLGCHSFGPESRVHPQPEGQHSSVLQGCEGCHGPSADHKSRPTVAAPDVSFGPRWTASTAEQDGQCLNCHQQDVAAHWQDALHMVNNISCTACHSVHSAKDLTLNRKTQAEVCTTCHKTQKQGIHGNERIRKMNPECTQCHNPHADQSAVVTMLGNGSAGCQKCHKLSTMARSTKVSEKAKSYHRVMENSGEKTCSSCHQGVAHGDTAALERFMPLATSRREVTLFYPGQSDSEWILSVHPGSQPFRQGSNCQQCHRGDEVDMGKTLGGDAPSSQVIDVSFRVSDGQLLMQASWPGAADDADIALMWGYGVNDEFRRGGCWAACHNDMPGMRRDRGVGLGKYLKVSRSQQQRIGYGPLVASATELDALMVAGNFVEMWRINLQDAGKAQTAILLDSLHWMDAAAITTTASYTDGVWNVSVRRPLQPMPPLKPIAAGTRYTFGIAMHGAGRENAKHWVSLPMTFSLDDSETDFRAD